ncbi:recombinase family protein [Streptomyces sp. NPDC087420]|uniref:recombinase family protein n=1 Tax=Streptomyces sp. NPDC087420 TaxID=3365785 RepID=UPI003832E119
MPVIVGAYERISDDAEDTGAGVERQREDCHALASIRRWDIARDYEDNDLSAYQRKVVRPQFEQMLTDLESGVIKGVVVYDLDRLVRQPRDLERLIDIYEENPGYVFSSYQGDIDLTSPDGRTMARVMVAFANKSSADTSRRVKRKQAALVAEGKLLHGGRRPWGWLPDGSVDPDAKREILAGHARILAGDRISAIQDDWAERGVGPTNAQGARYVGSVKSGKAPGAVRHKTVQHALTHPALAGIKTYRGEVVAGTDGAPISGNWERICSPAELDAVVTALRDRARTTRGGQGVAKYLLSGIARCGACGKGMRGGVKRASYLYSCNNYSPDFRCGKVGRAGAPVDDLIIDLVLADRHRRRRGGEAPADAWSGAERLAQVQSEIGELIAARKAAKLSVAVLIELLPPLEAERDDLLYERRRLEAKAVQAKAAEAADVETREDFLTRPLDRQRALVLQSLKAVIIHPSGRTGHKFNPDLIEPIWAA